MSDHPESFPTPEEFAKQFEPRGRPVTRKTAFLVYVALVEERDRQWRAYIAENSDPDNKYADFDPYGHEGDEIEPA